MWYRKAKSPIDWKTDSEPTIYLDTLTLQPTTRSKMLEMVPDDIFEEFDMTFKEARAETNKFDEQDHDPFGDLGKGLDVLEHDLQEALVGQGNSATDKMHRHRKPQQALDMRHVTTHGRHYMNLESKAKREKRSNDFVGVQPTGVDTYIGALWKAKNPLLPDDGPIRFG
jgi:hypothetical protein